MGDFDKILNNCRVLDVRTGRVYNADIAIKGGIIAAVGENLGEGEDMGNMFALPGFIDAHVHIESSQLIPSRFAQAAVPCGTTLVVADPHEIANVCGMDGVDFMIKDAANTPLEVKMMMPSCVPASPAESSGAVLDAAAVKEALAREDIFGLGEMMNYPGVTGGDEDVLAKLKAARDAGKPIDGHFPMGSGLELAAYAAEGISSDHECNDAKEACDKIAAGMDVFIRQGSAGKQLLDILPAVNKENISHFSLCTDDCHAADILEYGHINHIVAQAVEAGMSAADAVRLATLNPAEHYKLNCGAIEAGKQADIIFVPDLVHFKPVMVFKRGEMVAVKGRPLFPVAAADCSKVKNTLHMPPVTKEKLKLKGASLTWAMKIKAGSLVKEAVKYKEGLPKLCVAERHKNTAAASRNTTWMFLPVQWKNLFSFSFITVLMPVRTILHSFVMVRFALHDCEGPVKLFKEHQPYQLVRKSHPRQGNHGARPVIQPGGKAVRPAYHENHVPGIMQKPFLQLRGPSQRIVFLSMLVQKHYLVGRFYVFEDIVGLLFLNLCPGQRRSPLHIRYLYHAESGIVPYAPAIHIDTFLQISPVRLSYRQ